jgi:hypothetical protein
MSVAFCGVFKNYIPVLGSGDEELLRIFKIRYFLELLGSGVKNYQSLLL